ncbi:MAG: M24 family metallopeptidase, partial [Planctomycetes bacterium]|nr:M24 family metallopeptidase [Planctomycetota bacterium]
MRVERVTLPDIPEANQYPAIRAEEIRSRYSKIVQRMSELELAVIIIYGDREHFANLSYVTGGYDARFEEALLIIRKNEVPVLITGNEGYSYCEISLLEHKRELFQTFSLQGQTRDRKIYLHRILADNGIDARSKIGIIGNKYYEEGETEVPEKTFDVPHYIIQEVTRLAPIENISNVTSIMTHPENGIRTSITEDEIARFEYMSSYVSDEMRRLLGGLRIGISETQLLATMRYRGFPFSAHPVVGFGAERVMLGLASPIPDSYLKRGDAVNLAIGVEGANIARTGCAVASDSEFTGERKNIVDDFYFPYFRALKSWYEKLRVGEQSRTIYSSVMDVIGAPKFGVGLNPGHQIHLEEWINSPFRHDRNYALTTGMALQCDLIAFPGQPYVGVHVEDTLVLADRDLQ